MVAEGPFSADMGDSYDTSVAKEKRVPSGVAGRGGPSVAQVRHASRGAPRVFIERVDSARHLELLERAVCGTEGER